MNGVFHKGLKDFTVERYGRDTWRAARDAAGVEERVYLPVDSFPDHEFIELVQALAAEAPDSPFEVLEAFGRFVAGRLVETYGGMIEDDWDAMDLLEHLESSVHEPLRTHNERLDPPRIEATRDGPSQVTIRYRSPRKLCPVATGLIRGVADHYDQEVYVSEPRCMHEGDDLCELVVSRYG
jgi:predicted hydrocarbon binding protein